MAPTRWDPFAEIARLQDQLFRGYGLDVPSREGGAFARFQLAQPVVDGPGIYRRFRVHGNDDIERPQAASAVRRISG